MSERPNQHSGSIQEKTRLPSQPGKGQSSPIEKAISLLRNEQVQRDILLKKISSQNAHIVELQHHLVQSVGAVQPAGSAFSAYTPIEVQEVISAKGTVFAMAGMALSFAFPIAEFFGVLGTSDFNVVFIKDFKQCWYQGGLIGVSNTRSETVNYIKSTFSHLPRPWIFVGNSAGGFAALYFGARLEADRVVAFAPQTYISHENRAFFQPKLPPQICTLDDPENDLRDLLASASKHSSIHLHYSRGMPHDAKAVAHVSHISDLNIHAHEGSNHGIARELRTSGSLLPAIFGEYR